MREGQTTAARAPQIDWKGLLELLSPSGQQAIVEFIAEARETRGAGWLEELQKEFPFASWIVELVCTRDADDALTEIADAYPKLPVKLLAGSAIKTLHAKLKYEIEKPREGLTR